MTAQKLDDAHFEMSIGSNKSNSIYFMPIDLKIRLLLAVCSNCSLHHKRTPLLILIVILTLTIEIKRLAILVRTKLFPGKHIDNIRVNANRLDKYKLDC